MSCSDKYPPGLLYTTNTARRGGYSSKVRSYKRKRETKVGFMGLVAMRSINSYILLLYTKHLMADRSIGLRG